MLVSRPAHYNVFFNLFVFVSFHSSIRPQVPISNLGLKWVPTRDLGSSQKKKYRSVKTQRSTSEFRTWRKYIFRGFVSNKTEQSYEVRRGVGNESVEFTFLERRL